MVWRLRWQANVNMVQELVLVYKEYLSVTVTAGAWAEQVVVRYELFIETLSVVCFSNFVS
jgi:hypothetical protein